LDLSHHHAQQSPSLNINNPSSKPTQQQKVDDTPAQAAPTEGCPKSRDTCPQPGEDAVWNGMDYTDDRCMKGFTAGQQKRMEAMRLLHRAD
jgi:hypothetical protein